MTTRSSIMSALLGAGAALLLAAGIVAMFQDVEPVGLVAGGELVFFGVVLGFRHYYDGFAYPWQIPVAFYGVGVCVILIITHFVLVDSVLSDPLGLLTYTAIGVLGAALFYYVWYEFPTEYARGDAA